MWSEGQKHNILQWLEVLYILMLYILMVNDG